jgi:NAD(P)-dependent dehydrogenase (short-subunit alcohol dehydrogenase family)
MKELRGKVVVITGAGSGIGRATALRFARAGARLHLVDIAPGGLAAVCAEAEGLGARATAHQLDCADSAAVERLAVAVYAEPEGRVDVLHNNAGVCLGGPVENISLADWRWIVDVNLWSVIHGVRSFVPRMIAQGHGGHVVNTASMAGLIGLPFVAPYCATKFAVVGLSESLATELARHDIHVSVICPGGTRTGVLANARLELPEKFSSWLTKAMARWAPDPDSVARQVVDAVRAERSFVMTGVDLLPLWALRRVSIPLYHRVAGALTKWAHAALSRPA